MFSNKQTGFLLLVTVVLLVAFSAEAKTRKMHRVATGSWGGPHIRLEVGAHSATIDYDCAHGSIDVPLTVDSKGRFTWRGTHIQEGPGPIRVDQESNDNPAIYTGTVKGDKMTMTLKLAGSDEIVNTFTLTRGGAGRVFKCK